MKQAIQAGHSIGTIATLPVPELARIAKLPVAGETPDEQLSDSAEGFIAQSVLAIQELNTKKLEEILTKAILKLGHHGLLERVVGPLAHRVGELWRAGKLMAAHEHFASAIIRAFLAENSRPFSWTEEMPTLTVATPSGQLHELGAVMVAAAGNDLGWRVVYLGTSLPAAEIAGAAVQNKSVAVALSIVYPADDPNLDKELEKLRRYLPDRVRIIVGGRSAGSYSEALNRIGAVRPADLAELYQILDGLRVGRK